MVQLMGMGWDMGPPFWPYQAVYDLLFTINAPAFVISIPILSLTNFRSHFVLRYGVLFLAIVCWWWWIGTRIDFGILGGRRYRHAKRIAGLLAVVSVGLLFLAVHETLNEFHWWMEFGRGHSPYRLPTLFQNRRASFVVSRACQRMFDSREAPVPRKPISNSGQILISLIGMWERRGCQKLSEDKTAFPAPPRVLERSVRIRLRKNQSVCKTRLPKSFPRHRPTKRCHCE